MRNPDRCASALAIRDCGCVRGDKMATAKTTTDHDEIRKWAEDRGGRPATVQRTANSEDPGILRIDFPGYSGQASLVEITWEDFFKKFDEQQLAFLHQDKTAGGEPSRFNKLVSRNSSGEKKPRASSSSRSSTGSKSGTSSRSSGSKTASKASSKTTSEKSSTKAPQKSTASRSTAAKKKS